MTYIVININDLYGKHVKGQRRIEKICDPMCAFMASIGWPLSEVWGYHLKTLVGQHQKAGNAEPIFFFKKSQTAAKAKHKVKR